MCSFQGTIKNPGETDPVFEERWLRRMGNQPLEVRPHLRTPWVVNLEPWQPGCLVLRKQHKKTKAICHDPHLETERTRMGMRQNGEKAVASFLPPKQIKLERVLKTHTDTQPHSHTDTQPHRHGNSKQQPNNNNKKRNTKTRAQQR